MCTLEKRGNVYLITLTGSDEHRLTPTLIDSIRSAVHKVRTESSISPCSALITTAHGKYFSNGLELAFAKSSLSKPQTAPSKLELLLEELISLPMPTIAAVTGHASAAGMLLALGHDYVLMRKDRGFLYMSEMDIGLVIPNWFVRLLKSKIGDANVRREVILMAKKLTAEMAVERGIVYSAHANAEKTVEAAIELAEELVKRGWNGDVYAKNRLVLLGDVLDEQKMKTTSKL